LEKDPYYDFDNDNQIIATEKYDTKHTYKHTKGYFPDVSTIGTIQRETFHPAGLHSA
jgi:hypothetical protein